MTAHRRHKPTRDPLLLGAVVIAGMAAVFLLSLFHTIPFVGGDQGRVVHARFAAARQVNAKTPVRVEGVGVGKVESVRYDTATRTTDVALRITDDDVVLHADASAALRWRTMLGGRMELALDPGSASAPPLDGQTITRTRIQTELEDITHVFDGDGTQGQRALLQELPRALGGDAAGRAIDATPGALRPLAPAVRALRGERGDDLERLVASSARALRAMASARGDLGALVTGAQRTFRTTADDRAELAASLRRAPAALDATVVVAGAIRTTLPALDALVADLRPGARALGPTLARTRPTLNLLDEVLGDARPLLRRLQPAVRHLADLSQTGRRLLTAVDPTLRRLSDDLVPFLERTDPESKLPVYQMVGPNLASQAAMASQFDDTGHVLNFPTAPGENSVALLPCTTLLTDPTAQQAVRCDALNRALRLVFGGRRARR